MMNDQAVKPSEKLITMEQFIAAEEIVRGIYGVNDPYTVTHLRLAGEFAETLISKFPTLTLGDQLAIRFAAIAHDLMKGKTFVATEPNIIINSHEIDQDTERYVRDHLDDLKPFGLETYIYTDIQLHALASGIFVKRELGITDERALYAIFFHSCPILPIYEALSDQTKLIIDIVVLADKLSSNKLKPGLGKRVALDLSLAVFGESGMECNFTLGVYLARLISQGKSKETHSLRMTEHYYQRASKQNPLLAMIEQPIKLKKPKKDKDSKKEEKEGDNDGQESSSNAAAGDREVAGGDATSVTE